MGGLISFIIIEMGLFLTGGGLVIALLTAQQSNQNEAALAYVLIGAALGLLLGSLFAQMLKRNLTNFMHYPALPLWLGAGVGGWFFGGLLLFIRSGQPSDWRIIATTTALGTVAGSFVGGFFSNRLRQFALPLAAPASVQEIPSYIPYPPLAMFAEVADNDYPELAQPRISLNELPDWVNNLFANNKIAAQACRQLYYQIKDLNQTKNGLPLEHGEQAISRITDDFKTYVGKFRMKMPQSPEFLTFYFECGINFPQQPPKLFIEKSLTEYEDGLELIYSGRVFNNWENTHLTLHDIVDDVITELNL